MRAPEHRFASTKRPRPRRPALSAVPHFPLIAVLSLGIGGCGQGAPSFVFFGAYFPSWLLLAMIGVLAAAATRAVMVTTGLAAIIPYQLVCCTALGVTFAIVCWLIWFAG